MLALALCLAFGQAGAEQPRTLNGVALVIGQSAYRHLSRLVNPENDTREIERLLDDLGFDVRSASDRDASRLHRELDRFIEDAADADVALFYYSGHGVEAGGENYLVPVDSDLSALDAAGEKLVPLSGVVEQLKATVPVTILLLDACRSNPFPPGKLLRPNPAAEPVAAGAGGLGLPRGAKALSRSVAAEETFGTVIGFAAEPGKVAHDGPAGGVSPYAAALARHLSAMQGEEFGTVLRLVAEEVYLKTGGRQRPWVNESLRRLLYFGSAPDAVEGAEGDILTERRQLLLTIAALPEAGRARIEAVAREDGVPMDALYGVLRALGADTPSDLAELEKLLREQTVRLKTMLVERDALQSRDFEIARLIGLADRALGEGALATASRLLGDAKARVAALETAVTDAEADIAEKRKEFAAVYARSGDANALAFKHAEAARDYAAAFDQVFRWDDRLAYDYKQRQITALLHLGALRGDNAALDQAIAEGDTATRLASTFHDRSFWAHTRTIVGEAHRILGQRQGSAERFRLSLAAYRDALGAIDPDRTPALRAAAENDFGNALSEAAITIGDASMLIQAIDAYQRAIAYFETVGARNEWAAAKNNLGKVHLTLAVQNHGDDDLSKAGVNFEAALSQTDRAADPYQWAAIQNNLGNVYFEMAGRLWREGEDAATAMTVNARAAVAYGSAIDAMDRARAPFDWASVQANLSRALVLLAENLPDEPGTTDILRDAIVAKNAALEEVTPANWPRQHARLAEELGNLHQTLGERLGDTGEAAAAFEAAVKAYRMAAGAIDRHTEPDIWASLQHDIGRSLMHFGEHGGGLAAYADALETYRAAVAIRTPDKDALNAAMSRAGYAHALSKVAIETSDRAMLLKAKALTMEVVDAIRPLDRQYDGILTERMARIEEALARLN